MMMENNFVRVGQIVNTFGIRGELKIYLYTDSPEKRFFKGNDLILGTEEKPTFQKVTISSAKPYKNLYLIKLEGYDNINQVEKYKGMFLWLPREEQGELEEGEFYYHQIVGSQVFTTDGTELGTVKEILSPGANDVWVIKPKNGKKEILIPYIEDVVKKVDVESGVITIELLEGLLD